MGEHKRKGRDVTPMKGVTPTPEMEAARLAMIAAVKPYADALGATGMLACAAYTVGQLIALQDQRSVTPAMAIDLVQANIEAGNQHAMAEVMAAGGRPS